MNCPKCGFEMADGTPVCDKCGIVISKYLARLESTANGQAALNAVSLAIDSADSESGFSIRELLFYVPGEVNYFYLAGRAIVLLVMFFWGLKFFSSTIASNYSGESFLHMVNLPFHEAGHVIFRIFFSRFIMVLGGSLGQLIIPLVCLVALLFKSRDTFGAGVCLWWFGENFLDLAPYINDARARVLILLGGLNGRESESYGVIHDWYYILGHLGWLRYDHVLANAAAFIGKSLMACALLWGGLILFKQFKAGH